VGREGSKGAEGNRDAAGARAGTLVLGEDGRERDGSSEYSNACQISEAPSVLICHTVTDASHGSWMSGGVEGDGTWCISGMQA